MMRSQMIAAALVGCWIASASAHETFDTGIAACDMLYSIAYTCMSKIGGRDAAKTIEDQATETKALIASDPSGRTIRENICRSALPQYQQMTKNGLCGDALDPRVDHVAPVPSDGAASKINKVGAAFDTGIPSCDRYYSLVYACTLKQAGPDAANSVRDQASEVVPETRTGS